MTDSTSEQSTTQSSEMDLLSPPSWILQIGYWFRIGFSLFLLLSVLVSMASCSSSAAFVPWQKASAIAPESVLEEVIQTHTELESTQAEKTLLGWAVAGKEGKLVLFNFNTPNLCGSLGCLYSGYWLRKNQPATEVFLSYLNPNLPADKPLFEVGEDRGQALPCLKVLQMEVERSRRLEYCFNGDRYQLANSLLWDGEQRSNK